GQDDIVGGNSDLFTLTSPGQRPDAPNLIFGGSGTDIAIDDNGPSVATANAHDSDAIVANNGDIVRLVAATGFLQFAYDTYSATVHIVPRAITLLDYTPGGPDYAGLTSSC